MQNTQYVHFFSINRKWPALLPLIFCIATANPPADIPGEEITERQYLDFIVPSDTIESKVPEESPYTPTWLDRVSVTWDGPPVAVQLAQDTKKMKMGMGAVFIPFMSDPSREPEIEIVDTAGEVVQTGKTGRKYSLMPGKYYVLVGSGSHQQKAVKEVIVTENKIIPLIPDWCAISIDVVDENNQPFRGEYEIARIDKFSPIGRGFGRNVDMGEEIKTWILRPGTYKIFGAGQSYNTLTNFVTIRLLPGEFVRFTLVQKDDANMDIIGGGTIETKTSSEIAKNWKYKIEIGGSIDFNSTYNHTTDTTETNETALSLIFRPSLTYEKGKIGWENRLRLSESVSMLRWKWNSLTSSADELQVRSMITWHFFTWFGPYGRVEVNTELFPKYARVPEDIDNHYFIIFNEEYKNPAFNTKDSTYKLQSSFSPLSVEPGIGATIAMPTTRFVEGKILTGVGLKYTRVRDLSEFIDTSDIIDSLLSVSDSTTLYNIIHGDSTSYNLIRKFNDKDAIEVGPEIILNLLFRLGRIALIETELEYFAPFERIQRPDFAFRSTLSWRLLRMLTLDYEYGYSFKQPPEEALQRNESRHRVLIRFSFISK